MPAKSKIWLGLDIGGTRLKGGIIDARNRVIAHDVELTRPRQSLRDLERQLDTLITRLTGDSSTTLAGIGAAITGPVDPNRGCVYLPGKIRGLDRHATVPYLRRRWQVPVTADNDGRLACLAEWRLGAGRGANNLVVFTLGTGIGSGVVLDGRLLGDGHFLRGTQVGHMVVSLGGPRCLTGPRGTGESVASVTALVSMVRDHLARGLPSVLAEKTPADIGFPEIARALRCRDRLVTGLFDDWLGRFATVMLNAYYAYAPELFVLAGGPMQAGRLFLGPLRSRLNTQAFRFPQNSPIPVRAATLGGDAGWIGAALRARESFKKG